MSEPNAKSRFHLPMHYRVLIAMLLGVIVGPALGKQAAALGTLGSITIQLIKAVATPLLFLAITRAIATTQVNGAIFGRMTLVAVINVSIAIVIGLSISNLFSPGTHLSATVSAAGSDYANKQLDLAKTIESFVPTDIVSPFMRNAVLSVAILALLLGFALRVVRRDERVDIATHAGLLIHGIDTLYRIVEVMLGWVLALIPIAVFGVVAKTTGEHGLAPLKGLAVYVGVGVLGLTLHALITYQAWIGLWSRLSLRDFWREAREPMVVALGANSSLATLPITLRALDRLGVSRSASAVGACVGTNLNNDGIVLYEGMAVLLVAQAHGVDLSIAQQLMVALVCMVAAMGVAGVPEAGFISLAIVLNAAGLPLDLLPMLLTVDWVIARGRSVVNVLSDMVLSIVIDRDTPNDAPTETPTDALAPATSAPEAP